MVIYDSVFGNTEQIAQAIGKGLTQQEPVPVRVAETVQPADLSGLELLVVGSPTRGMNYSDGLGEFLKRIPADALAGVKVAAFDTRISNEDMQDMVESPMTRFVVRTFLHRFAAAPIAKALEKKGAQSVITPEGFYVEDKEGPLKPGELERAEDWAREILATV